MITLQKAMEALMASQKKAQELGTTVSTAIVDNYGVLIAFAKMDGALTISPQFSQQKAQTSAAIGMPSGDIAAYATEGKPYFGIQNILGGQLTVIAGGIPVKMSGKVIGAVGVGGSMDVNQDVECAKAAAAVLEQG